MLDQIRNFLFSSDFVLFEEKHMFRPSYLGQAGAARERTEIIELFRCPSLSPMFGCAFQAPLNPGCFLRVE